MDSNQIEPGMVFFGTGGQIREVLAMDGKMVHYRQLHKGECRGGTASVGECRWIERHLFARFAQEEITEADPRLIPTIPRILIVGRPKPRRRAS